MQTLALLKSASLTFFKPVPNLHRRAYATRKHVSYNKNKSCSLKTSGVLKARTLKDYVPYIEEHAARRIDLFFYLLTAIFKTNTHFNKGITCLQHGKGSKINGTAACHSAFISNLTPVTKSLSPLHGSFFFNNLNSTVELPVEVNFFDSNLERFLLKQCSILTWVNRVSEGDVTPIEGLNQLYGYLTIFFNSRKLDGYNSLIVKAQKKGSFSGAIDGKYVASCDYLSLLLRLRPEEKCALRASGIIPEENFFKIQNEIISSSPSP